MRRLAERLDAWPMSIYTYFRDKDELLDALTANAVEGLSLPSPRASWRNQVRSLLHEARGALGGDVGGLASRLPRGIESPRLSGALREILIGAGLGERDAATAWRVLVAYAVGAAPGDAEFERGLDLVLDGVATRAASSPARTGGSSA